MSIKKNVCKPEGDVQVEEVHNTNDDEPYAD